MKTRSALSINKNVDINEENQPDEKLNTKKRKISNSSKLPKTKKNKQNLDDSSNLSPKKFELKTAQNEEDGIVQPKIIKNEDVEKSDESEWEEVDEDEGLKSVSEFDKNLIEKISNIGGEVQGSYQEFMSNGTDVKSLDENDVKPAAIQINLPTGDRKGGNYEAGLTEEEKRQQLAEARRKLMIQRKLKNLERIHKAHLLCLLAHAYYVNGVCNEAPLRNLLVNMISSAPPSTQATSGLQNKGKKLSSSKKGLNHTEKQSNVRLTSKNSKIESIDHKDEEVPSSKISLVYSKFSNKIDVPAIVKWIQTTFLSQSFDDPKMAGLLASKNLSSRLMVCAYKKVNPEILAKFPYPVSSNYKTVGKKEKISVPKLDTTCRIGYLNLIAIALLRSLGIETRLVVNLIPTPLKLPRHGHTKKEKERELSKTDEKKNEKVAKKSSPKSSKNVHSQQSTFPVVQYWLEARLDQSQNGGTSSEHAQMRWVTINCVKDVNPQVWSNTTKKVEEETNEISPGKRTRSKSTTQETDSKSSAVLKVSPYFKKSSALKQVNDSYIEAPESVVRSLKLPKTIVFVIGLTEKNYVRDLTVKYAPDWHINGRKLRIGFRSEEHGWWHTTLERLNSKISTEHHDVLTAGNKKKGRKIKSAKVIKKEVEALEENEILAVSQKRPLPTTINEYKDHPLYVLKRHLLRNQAIYPLDAKPVGYVRNEPVYLRENLHNLKARINWLKDDARLVRLDEKGYKLVLKRPSLKEFRRRKRLKEAALAQGLSLEGPSLSEKQNISEDGVENENETKSLASDPGGKEMEELFGIWQTDPYISPPVVNGKIPRNTFGNVELFQMSMLPVGTVYVSDMPGLNKVASKIGKECVPAMRGWEFGRSGAHPILDGWVILEEDQERLLDEWDRFQVENQLAEIQKKEKRALENWRKFTRALLIKERIQAKYGTTDEILKVSEKSAIPKKKSSKKRENIETLSTAPSNSPWGESSLKALANTVLDLASYESNAKTL